ncbi:putative beta-1,3-galactosyltransferase 16 [Capsicum annuum]|uniref:hydroxyproline O-galactosyltransferase GALT3 n=1 Tax=Capsicum annuum TaxID=4072 RepID=UPI001FB12803|nr:hydroxyproline O-galactosyltransferase GALT3 [Capsicum annuum]XP_047268659.1 hydroxyproline O-galactosyltransferase GALT3 [Capsicum annuum]KAF3659635.1 putative beta-1,3-galactosyltransferase 16 [Capsicum annuum]KAF3682448.1 putative beta-1,3-galactosyltransferase 16 [Capsicum annuum]
MKKYILTRKVGRKKWAGYLLIIGLALVLLVRYSSVEKSYSIVEKSGSSEGESPQKQSAYGFFNDHPDINEGPKDVKLKPVELVTFKEKPRLIDVEGLNDLYCLSNFSREESKALLAWSKMRLLLSRSDGLNGTAEGVKEAAIAWKDLVSFIEKSKASQVETENDDCPYSVTAFNTATLRDGSNLRIPCGLVEDSSITVIGIPDAKQESFQIELVGSKLPEETNRPIVLNYNVILPGENLTKDPLITQNTWTNDSGWGKVEKCPDHGSTDMIKVDGLVKCNAKIFRNYIQETANTTNPSDPKSTNVSNSSAYGAANYPFLEGNPFTATLWAGIEGFHMTVNGRHETSFAYREKLEPWLVSGVNVIGGVDTISILAKGLPVSNDLDLGYDVEHLKAPPTRKKRLVMLIGVFSTGNNFERRMALRKSWMQYEAVRSGEVAVRFFIGLDKNRQVNFELWKEAQAYGDIQLLPFVDYYSLLALKTIAICIMGVKILPAKYVMKTDDDAFVRIDEVLSSLKGKDPNGILYGGISFDSAPHRDKDNKWYISPEEYPPSSYPPWAHGPGYIISRDIAKFIVQGHQERELMLFKLEDVAVGIWVEEFRRKGDKVQYVDNERFYNAGCESGYILAHYQNPRMVLCLWEKLQKEHEPNCCE